MKRICLLLLLLTSTAFGQLAAPLNDAALLYRAQAYDPNNTAIPSEGTRTEPLLLGPTLGTDARDPVFVADATIGDHWRFPIGVDAYAVSPVPSSVLNGDVTFALRYRTEALYADRLLFYVFDPEPAPYGTKHFLLHQTSTNKYMARFWEKPPHWNQIISTSTTATDLSRTDTVVSTWSTADQQNRLYVNGFLESISGAGFPRTDAVTSGLNVSYHTTNLHTAGKIFAMATWQRAITGQEVIDLQSNPDWNSGGGSPPPPPPPMGVLRVFINGVEYPGATVKIDGVAVPPPTGETDKIVEVDSP